MSKTEERLRLMTQRAHRRDIMRTLRWRWSWRGARRLREAGELYAITPRPPSDDYPGESTADFYVRLVHVAEFSKRFREHVAAFFDEHADGDRLPPRFLR